MVYNITELGLVNNVKDLFMVTNTATGDILFGMFMIVISFTLFYMMRGEFIDKLLTMSFICFILSSFLVYAEILSLMYPLTYLIITIICVWYLSATKSSE